MSLLDVIRENETYDAKAKAESLGYSCDICHVAEGVTFTDYYWTCTDCRTKYLAAIAREALVAAVAIGDAA